MKNIIEINGRHYDAITGKLLNGNSINKPSDTQRSNHSPIQTHGMNIDGVNRKKDPQVAKRVNNEQPKAVGNENSSQNTSNNVKRQTPKVVDGLRKKPQRSVTLSRKFVKKPHRSLATPPSVIAKSSPTDRPDANLEKQDAYTRFSVFRKVPDAKIAKAISHKTSSAISKFSRTPAVHKSVVSTNIELAKAPPESSSVPNPLVTPAQKAQENSKPSVFEHHAIQPVSNDKSTSKDHSEIHHIKPYHKKTHYKVRSRRYLAGLVAACFAVFLFVGFLAYQKVPQIAVKVAARNAGFDAKVPSNIPSGYAFKSPVDSSKDKLTIQYKSNTDKRSFKITQKPSNWTSESLLSNYLIEGKKQYQAYYNKGMTVFIYDNSNATWVDKGVWFTLDADGSLSSDQILSIASSI